MSTIAIYASQSIKMSGLLSETRTSVENYKTELLTLKSKMLEIDPIVCNMDDVISFIQVSTQTQENKVASIDALDKNTEKFITDVVEIDSAVSDIIKQRTDDFYAGYPYLKPEYEKIWLIGSVVGLLTLKEWCEKQWLLNAMTITTSAYSGLKGKAQNSSKYIDKSDHGSQQRKKQRFFDLEQEDIGTKENEIEDQCEVGQFVGYLSYGAEGIVDDPNGGFYKLYDNPTLATEGEQIYFNELYSSYGQEPYGALQAYGDENSILNTNGDSTYGGQSLDPYKGTIVYNGMERYAIALGPALQNPDFTVGELHAKEMIYGTCVDITIELEGNTYYIPAVIVDVKANTYPTGVFQTGIPFTDELAAAEGKERDKLIEELKQDTGKPGNIVEWYTYQFDGNNNKSAGLAQFNRTGSIIIYRDERME